MAKETKLEMKKCTNPNCEDPNLPATTEYFYKQKKYDKQGTPYYDLSSWCKNCNKKNARKWAINNPEKMREAFKKCDSSDKRKKVKGDFSKKQKDNGYYKKWQHENTDKISEYNLNRNIHKKHEISDEEWYACLDYFNNKCAYCNLSEEDQFKMYGENFHMEHVDHNGSNYIDNCVPACTSCNTSKHTNGFKDWYNENNPIFSKRRLNKIIKWITDECLKVLNLK